MNSQINYYLWGMVIIVMGVSGSGKTHIGEMLAEALSLPFHDADDYHTPGNVRKMEQGIPLTDKDRLPWLKILADHVDEWNAQGGRVLACSALKESYRRLLSHQYQADVQFVYLRGSRDLILSRMHARDHFFPPHLLDSQFTELEEPKRAIAVGIDQAPEAIVVEIITALRDQ